MKLAYFDCFSGISGDMVLGALVDAGCEIEQLERELGRLSLKGWKISAARVARRALTATHVRVESLEHHHHRGLGAILDLIEKAQFPPEIGRRAAEIFQRLGEAEARVHNVPIEKVHFHEVGAVDSIVDIVGACIGLARLGIEQFACSPLNVGSGSVETAHGKLPVPAPATAELLRGAPTYSTGIPRELVTPTGAAIVSTLVTQFGPQPPMTVTAVGYGAGTTELEEQPNALRLFVGEAAERTESLRWDDTVVVLEANLDDMNPQLYGYFAERALAAGALDVFAAPVQMKKNRPGQWVTVLCAPGAAETLTGLIFRETTTIGVRRSEVRRRVLRREDVSVETRYGAVRVKVSGLNGHALNAAPEYEDCRRIAAERGVPLKEVLNEALAEFHRRQGESRSE